MSRHTPVNILMVDDQPAKLLSYEAILAELDETLIRANSGREALEILLKTDIAVVLIDVCMPEIDGFDLAKMLRNHPRFERTAIIFVSGVQMSEADLVKGYATGAVDYISVPVIPEVLRARIRIFVDLYRKTRELQRFNSELENRVKERTGALERSNGQLRENEERLRLASEAAGFCTYDYHANDGTMYWSSQLAGMVGAPNLEAAPLQSALQFVHPDHRDLVYRHIVNYAPDSGRREIEFKIVRPNGEVRWMLERGQTIADPQSATCWRVMGTLLDITERKRAEEYQRILNLELDHRVKNILANVSAVARLSARNPQSIEEFVTSLSNRLQTLASAHDLLRKASWGTVDLEELAQQTLAPFRNQNGDNVKIAGERLTVAPQSTQSLALILHELATNAAKYGAWSVRDGYVSLSWHRAPGNRNVKLVWQETGAPLVKTPKRRGFGLLFLEVGASEFGGTGVSEFLPGGLCYTLEIPAESGALLPGASNGNKPAAHIRSSPPAEAGSGGRMRVLIVEDELVIAMQLKADLEDAGHHVVGPARSVAQALGLANQQIDAALIDYRLGRETSVPVAECLIGRNVPFALATGYVDDSIIPEHLRHRPRLRKPYTPSDLQKIIAQLAGERSASN